jgi:predicted Fe-Mo cluster-binding NifX family protein
MLIAVTSTGESSDSKVDPRFARCPYYIIFQTDDASFAAVPNSSAAMGGAARALS